MRIPFFYTTLYIALIVAINWGFSHVPLIPLADGTLWPPLSLAVGFVFVARDYAQRETGHWVLVAMLIGVTLSYVMADPYVAVASAVAFLISELADWSVYSFTKRPFSQRILYSSALGAPVDSVVFLAMIGHLSATGVIAMTLSKLLGAFFVWWLIRRREEVGQA